jgi:hypothetical protein
MHAVYRIFGTKGEALYVGCSDHPFTRLGQQARRHPELVTPAHVEFSYHESRLEALSVELAEIKRLRPVVNVRGLHPEPGRVDAGEVLRRVRLTVEQMGEATSSQVADRLPDLPRSSVWATMFRLRQTGELKVVGTAPHPVAGRRQFVVRPVGSAA